MPKTAITPITAIGIILVKSLSGDGEGCWLAPGLLFCDVLKSVSNPLRSMLGLKLGCELVGVTVVVGVLLVLLLLPLVVCTVVLLVVVVWVDLLQFDRIQLLLAIWLMSVVILVRLLDTLLTTFPGAFNKPFR